MATPFPSRRPFLFSPASAPSYEIILSPPSEPAAATFGSFKADVIIVVAALVCSVVAALVCSVVAGLALNTAVRFGLDQAWFAPTLDPLREQPDHCRVRRKALKALPVLAYSPRLRLPGSGSDCAICLSDFASGERVRVLPRCSHGFHVLCIDRWLVSNPSCPSCRQCLFGVGRVALGCGNAGLDLEDPVGIHWGC